MFSGALKKTMFEFSGAVFVTLIALCIDDGAYAQLVTNPFVMIQQTTELTATDSLLSGAGVDRIESFSQIEAAGGGLVGAFIFLPGIDGSVDDAPAEMMQIAAGRLEPFLNGGRIGLFALSPGSSDYNQVSVVIELPGVMAVAMGRGATVATGLLSEAKLFDAFAAAASAGGCGTSGCM